MRLSNKSTFSLVCFILLLAFVALPVIAHDGTHPLNEDIVGDNPATPDTVETDFVITAAHNGHPTPTITLMSGDTVRGSAIKVVTDDGDNDNGVENQFTLIIDFGQDIVGDNATATVDDTSGTSPLAANEFTEAVLNALGATATGVITIGTPTRVDLTPDDATDTIDIITF